MVLFQSWLSDAHAVKNLFQLSQQKHVTFVERKSVVVNISIILRIELKRSFRKSKKISEVITHP